MFCYLILLSHRIYHNKNHFLASSYKYYCTVFQIFKSLTTTLTPSYFVLSTSKSDQT